MTDNSPFIYVEGLVLLNVPCAADLARECITEDCYQIKSLKGQWAVADIGACYGEFSLFAASLGHKVHAYEPSSESVFVMEANNHIRAGNPIERIYKCAVTNTKEHAHHYWRHHPAGSGPDCGFGISYPVKTKTMQQVVAGLQDYKLPIFVKMDCEGMEVQNFVEQDWIDLVDAVSMETHSHDADLFGSILKEQGFYVQLLGTSPYPLPQWDKSMTGGLVIARR